MKLRCVIRRGVLLHSYSERDPPSAMNVLADQEVLYRALGVQRLLNLNDVIRLLRSGAKRVGSQRAFARKAGVNVSVVSKTLRGWYYHQKRSSAPSTFGLSIYPNDVLRKRRCGNVGYWQKADIARLSPNVRFWGQSGHHKRMRCNVCC